MFLVSTHNSECRKIEMQFIRYLWVRTLRIEIFQKCFFFSKIVDCIVLKRICYHLAAGIERRWKDFPTFIIQRNTKKILGNVLKIFFFSPINKNREI
jgi:hypothetical protein